MGTVPCPPPPHLPALPPSPGQKLRPDEAGRGEAAPVCVGGVMLGSHLQPAAPPQPRERPGCGPSLMPTSLRRNTLQDGLR